MEARGERRAEKGRRIPLDVLVELLHEDYEEPFEADALNLGAGGLSMRAPYLPDVGARMVCRFECPPTGDRIEADAEVVWAQDTGAHTGEFGLRFVTLGDEAQRAIRRMVGGSYTPPPPTEQATDTIDEQAAGTVELRLDGVASPILARVIHASRHGVAVEQDLPFLRLRTGVTLPDGRRGRIEAVDLAIEGETPRLLLDVSYDERSFAVPEADATVPDFISIAEVGAPAPRIVDAMPARSRIEPDVEEPDTVEEPPAAASIELALRDAIETASPPPEIVAAQRPEPPSPAVGPIDSDIRALRSATGAGAIWARLLPALALVRARLAVLAAGARPFAGEALSAARRASARAGTHALPWARRAARAIVAFALRAVSLARMQLGRVFPRLAPPSSRRRTTSAAPQKQEATRRLRKQKQEEVIVASRGKGRTVLVGIIAVAAIGLGIYAFLPADEPPVPERIAVHREIAPPPASEGPSALAAENGDTSALENEPAASATAGQPVTPSMPTAMGDPSREAGPMPPPTFPSLREGARPAAPSTLPEGSPYAVDVRNPDQQPTQTVTTQSPSTFGDASVPHGRTFVIRMSRPVEQIDGTRLTDGFSVRIPGSLSLDRAGPIASAHPLVDRSMILNRGDHAELTIHFVAGRTPAYRVAARGSAIEVLIGE